MKPSGLFLAHFTSGVLATCLVGVGAYCGWEAWEKYTSQRSDVQMEEHDVLVPIPRLGRVINPPVEVVDATLDVVERGPSEACEQDCERAPRKHIESDIGVDTQVKVLSNEGTSESREVDATIRPLSPAQVRMVSLPIVDML